MTSKRGSPVEDSWNTGAEFSAVPSICSMVHSLTQDYVLVYFQYVPTGLSAEFSRRLFGPCAFSIRNSYLFCGGRG